MNVSAKTSSLGGIPTLGWGISRLIWVVASNFAYAFDHHYTYNNPGSKLPLFQWHTVGIVAYFRARL